MSCAKHGDLVKVHYVGRNARGEIVDTTDEGPPRVARVGGDSLIAGLNAALPGMAEGEARTVVVPPERGYGIRKPGAVHRVPADMLPEQAGLGDRLYARMGEDVVEVWLTNVDAEIATLDENHPLAGDIIEYVLKLIEVEVS